MSTEDGLASPTTARLEAFADGVMAIAITLLILDVKVPHPAAGHSLGTALADQWPSYAAFVVSFLTIGIIWVNHHHMFTVIERSTHTFLMLNVLFLMTISALPWPTALVAAHLRHPDGRLVATLVYGGTMIAIAIMFNAVWRYASRDHRLLVDGVDPTALEQATKGYAAGPIGYTVITLMAFWSPWISLAAFAAMALYWLLPSSGPRLSRLVPAQGSKADGAGA